MPAEPHGADPQQRRSRRRSEPGVVGNKPRDQHRPVRNKSSVLPALTTSNSDGHNTLLKESSFCSTTGGTPTRAVLGTRGSKHQDQHKQHQGHARQHQQQQQQQRPQVDQPCSPKAAEASPGKLPHQQQQQQQHHHHQVLPSIAQPGTGAHHSQPLPRVPSLGRFLLEDDMVGVPSTPTADDEAEAKARHADFMRDPTDEGVMLRKAVRLGLCKSSDTNNPNTLLIRRKSALRERPSLPLLRTAISPLPWETQLVASSPTGMLVLNHKHLVHSSGALSAPTSPGKKLGPLGAAGGAAGTAAAALAALAALAATQPMHANGISYKMLKKLAFSVDAKQTTAEIVQGLILPSTAPTRCRYIDLLSEKHTGPPTYYIIHAWAANFRQLVLSLDVFLTDVRANFDDTYIWIDIISSNLHVTQSKENIARTKEIMDSADKSLLYLDNEGICLGRAWVQFELWHALTRSKGADKLSILANPGWAWEQLAHMYSSINIHEATTSVPNDRTLLMSDMSRSTDMSLFSQNLRRQVQQAAAADLTRTEKLASVNPKPHINTATSRAVFLVMERHLKDAEDTLKRLLNICNKARTEMRDVHDKDIIGVIIALAKVQRLLGKTSDAENVLQGLVVAFRGMKDDIYWEGVAMLAAVLMTRRQFTKAEMLCRKIMQEREADMGAGSGKLVPTLLQMADIAMAQRLNDEADEYLREALQACRHLEDDHPDLGRVKHKMAMVATGNLYDDHAVVVLQDALDTRTTILGWDHPETLETRVLEADYLARVAGLLPDEQRPPLLQPVLDKLLAIHKARNKTFGTDHPSSLEVWGRLSDVHYDMNESKNGLDYEKKILEVGRILLKHTHAEKFNSLIWISRFLAKRDHLLTSAALFLARAFQVYKEKLGVDHEVTLQTRAQLAELALTIKEEAASAYREAENSGSPAREQRLFSQAELLYRQALQVSKLINPVETEHKEIARGLADALFGQGKMQEGKKIMSSHGLSNASGRTAMPASYVRWFNKRVNNYLQKQADDAESREMAEVQATAGKGAKGAIDPFGGDGDLYDSSDDEDFM